VPSQRAGGGCRLAGENETVRQSDANRRNSLKIHIDSGRAQGKLRKRDEDKCGAGIFFLISRCPGSSFFTVSASSAERECAGDLRVFLEKMIQEFFPV